jgi:hypothetical protein
MQLSGVKGPQSSGQENISKVERPVSNVRNNSDTPFLTNPKNSLIAVPIPIKSPPIIFANQLSVTRDTSNP